MDGHWYNSSSGHFKIERMQIVWQKRHVASQAWTLKREGEGGYSVCVNGTEHVAQFRGASLVWGDGDVWVRKRELGARALERRLEVLDALRGHVVFGRIPGEEYSYRALLRGDRRSGELQLLVNERCLPVGAPCRGAKGREVAVSLPSGDGHSAAAGGERATYVLVQAVGVEELGRSDSLEQAFPLLNIESRAWAEAGLLKGTVKKIFRVLKGHFRLAASIFRKQRDLEDAQLLRQVADDTVGAQLPWHRQSNKYLQAYHLLKTSFANHPSLQGGEPQNFPTVVCDGRRGGDKCSVYDRVFSASRWRAPAPGAAEGAVHPFVRAILSKWRQDHDVDGFELVDAAALRPGAHSPSRSATAAPSRAAAAARRVLRVVRFEGAEEEEKAAAGLERALITTALKVDTLYERDGFVLVDARGAADPSAESLESARRLGRGLLRAPEGADRGAVNAKASAKAMRSFRGFKVGAGSEDTYFCGLIRGVVNKLILKRCRMPLYPMLCIDIPFGRLDCPNIAAGYNRCYGMARGSMAKASVQGASESYEHFDEQTRRFFDEVLCPHLFCGLTFQQANGVYHALEENVPSDGRTFHAQPIAVACGLVPLEDASWASAASRRVAEKIVSSRRAVPAAEEAERRRKVALALEGAAHHLLVAEGALRCKVVQEWVRNGKFFHWSNPSPMFLLVLEWRRRSWCCQHEDWVFRGEPSLEERLESWTLVPDV